MLPARAKKNPAHINESKAKSILSLEIESLGAFLTLRRKDHAEGAQCVLNWLKRSGKESARGRIVHLRISGRELTFTILRRIVKEHSVHDPEIPQKGGSCIPLTKSNQCIASNN